MTKERPYRGLWIGFLVLMWLVLWLLPRYFRQPWGIVHSRYLFLPSILLLVLAAGALASVAGRLIVICMRARGTPRIGIAASGLLGLTPLAVICGYQLLASDPPAQPAFLSVWYQWQQQPWDEAPKAQPAWAGPPLAPLSRILVEGSIRAGMTRGECYALLGTPMTCNRDLLTVSECWYLEDRRVLTVIFVGEKGKHAGGSPNDRIDRAAITSQLGHVYWSVSF